MELDTEELVQKYPNVSKEEIENIRESKYHRGMYHTTMERPVRILHSIREYEKIHGKESIIVGPLIHVLSVKFLPLDHQEPPLTISGRVYTQFHDNNSGKLIIHDLFNRNFHDAQVVLGLHGNDLLLSLTNPQPSSAWPLISMPLHNTRFVIDVVVGDKAVGAQYCCSDDELGDVEQVKQKYVHTDMGDFVLRYLTMPFGVYGEVQVIFFHKHGCKLVGRNHSFVDVKGKIVARYSKPGEVYDSEECPLFDKQSNEYERVDFEQDKCPLSGTSMKLSRCWVGLPINSSLFIELDLSEFESERKLLNKSLEFRVENQHFSSKDFIVDDMLIRVGVGWNPPIPQGKHNEKACSVIGEDESSDEDMSLQRASGNDSDDEHMIESSEAEASSNFKRPWWLSMHHSRPCPTPLVEIYSIYIHRDKFKSLQVYGFVEVSTLGTTICSFHRAANDPFILSEGSKTLPVSHGSLFYDDCDSLSMKINLKDVGSSMHIKGYIDWDDRKLECGTKWFNKPLCSAVEGEYGFAAIHYSFFPEAVKAHLVVVCTPKGKNGSGCLEGFPKVYGSIFAQHNLFDYTWHYNREYYRVELFHRNSDDPLQTSGVGELPLSRSLVVVPLHSLFTVEFSLCLCTGDDQDSFSSTMDLCNSKNDFCVKSESNDYSIYIYVKWVE